MRLTPSDALCLVLSGLMLAGILGHVVHQIYRRAHPKPRPPGCLTSVEQGRRAP